MSKGEELIGLLKTVDDRTLGELVTKAAEAMGVSEREKNAAMRHLPMVRNRLVRTRPEELEKMLGRLNEKDAAALTEAIRRNGKQ